jgi:HAE1 family hydrophobic/amphiphilic exporter-1
MLREKLSKVKDAKIFVQDLSLSGFSAKRGFPVEFTIRGPDWDILTQSSQKLMEAMNKTGLVTDVDSDFRAGMPEIQIIPNRKMASLRGVSLAEVNQTINAMVGGTIVGKYSRGNYRYDIRVRVKDDERMKKEDILSLYVRNNRGEMIPLRDVVTLKETKSLQAIAHQDRERAVSIFSNLAPGASQQKVIEEIQKIAAETLPQGYHAVVGGSAQTFQESFVQLGMALLLGLVVAYMILAAQFNSFIHPLTVLLALPFSLSGAYLGLLMGQQSINLYSMIGIILLMGIVKKNSILLVDFTNQMREKGLGVLDALKEACPVRLRPILMTSIATITGAIPGAMALGPGAESRMPMSIAVIGGVIVSTFLTLFVVPCAYKLFSWRVIKHESEKVKMAA